MHMLRKHSRWIALAATILSTSAALAQQETPIQVAAVGTQNNAGRVVLLISITNCGSTALRADIGNMPWGENTIGLTLRRVSEMPRAELRQIIPIRHSAP